MNAFTEFLNSRTYCTLETRFDKALWNWLALFECTASARLSRSRCCFLEYFKPSIAFIAFIYGDLIVLHLRAKVISFASRTYWTLESTFDKKSWNWLPPFECAFLSLLSRCCFGRGNFYPKMLHPLSNWYVYGDCLAIESPKQ